MHVRHFSDQTWEPVSHQPEIRKRVVCRPGEVAGLNQLAQARFAPGQVAASHAHPDLVEVFLVTSGTLTAVVDDRISPLPAGAVLVVEPHERHELRNDTSEEVLVTYFSLPTGLR